MTKKNQKNQKDEAAEELDAAEEKLELPDPTLSEGEADTVAAQPEDGEADGFSAEDLLDDVRRSLIADEEQEEQKKSSWWNKKGKKPRELPGEFITPDASFESEEALEQIDELIDLLEPEDDEDEAPKAIVPVAQTTVVAAPVVPEVPVNVDELKKRVFSPAETKEEPEISEVRAITLEGGEDVFVQVETRKADSLDDRVKAFGNSLRPYRRYMYYVTAFLGIVAAVLVAGMMYTLYQRSLPPEAPTQVSNLPYPTTVGLPGGVNFPLGRGSIKNGQWNPAGSEWLEGTEVCRWVSLPWSLQLEAVVRTFKQNDKIELTMSNNDKLSYNVYSIKQFTLAEMQKFDTNTPCLLVILTKQDSESRWVVTALP